MTKREGLIKLNSPIQRFLICFLAVGMMCGSVNAYEPARRADDSSSDASKLEVRNNAASLLYDLLGQEKNLSKILIIKHRGPVFKQLVKSISKTASDGHDQLDALAKSDNALHLDAAHLPPGETATRDAMSKTQEYRLLHTSGPTFELNLLLTQTDALDYASHLAQTAADNSPSPAAQQQFHALSVQLDALYRRVVARIRNIPAK